MAVEGGVLAEQEGEAGDGGANGRASGVPENSDGHGSRRSWPFEEGLARCGGVHHGGDPARGRGDDR
jgi:hypothetical protein